MNSFKELEEQQVRLFAERSGERMRDKLESTLSTLRFLGAVLEIYMPVMADTVVSLTGGEPIHDSDNDSQRKISNTPSDSSKLDPNDEPRGPGGGDSDGPIR